MSLKGDRYLLETDISYCMNSTATRGGCVTLVTGGSGSAMDQSQAAVAYAASSSGNIPIGWLLCDVVNLDLTRQHINWHQDQVQVGGKVPLVKKGYVVTNNITGTPVAGDSAFLTSSGDVLPYNTLNTTATNYKAPATINNAILPKVGRFLSSKDEDGYAKVEIDL